MASSNTIQNDILALFPDNVNKEISAADLRVFVDGIFGESEAHIVKIAKTTDLGSHSAVIFENSLIVVYDDNTKNGIYLSITNNPYDIVQLKKISGLVAGTADGDLKSDGSVPMDDGYSPVDGQDISTKQYVVDSVISASSGNPYPVDTYENFLFDFNTVKIANESEFFYLNGDIDNLNIRNDTTVFYNVSFTYLNGDIETRKIEKILGGSFCTTTFSYVSGAISDKQHVLTV